MKVREYPSYEYLNMILSYNSDTGELIWKERPRWMFKADWSHKHFNKKFSGKLAYGKSGTGYQHIGIFGTRYLSHIICWILYHWKQSDKEIDHINRVKTDNRICNLREVEPYKNCQNKDIRSDNTTGVSGVTRSARDKKFYSRITIKGKRIFLGTFEDINEAISERLKAELKYNFNK